jgi:para-aminobenzoate synthetase
MKTLIIDNHDSFTFNLFQLIAEVNGEPPVVVHNDQIDWETLAEQPFDNLVVSPGPGRPERAADLGIAGQAIAGADLPLLGVCLGHQGICHLAGAAIAPAPQPMHGRTSSIHHDGSPLFAGMPSPFSAVRYHSLVVSGVLPDELERIAWTADGLVMAVRHRSRPQWGVQFHPESICSEHGARLLENFRDLSRDWWASRPRRRAAPAMQLSVVPRGRRPVEPAPDLAIVHRRLDVWLDSERVFRALYAASPDAFWLDSSRAEPGLSRFSYMGDGSGPLARRVSCDLAAGTVTVEQHGEVRRESIGMLDHLERELARHHLPAGELPFDFNGGFVGYLGYELKAECTGRAAHRAPHPDAQLLFADRLLAFDHQERAIHAVCVTRPADRPRSLAWLDQIAGHLRVAAKTAEPVDPPRRGRLEWRLGRSPRQYLADIDTCLRHIRDGESYEVCLTNQLRAAGSADPLRLYTLLRAHNPAPYAALLRFGAMSVASSSPERFLRIGRDRMAESKPIKGTAPRLADPAADARAIELLRSSEKDRAENLMIVDLVRNDLGRVCEIGSVQVPRLMDIESFATVHHMVSTVRGRLRPELSVVDCIRATFPGGSMTGAPKVRTMELIDALEGEARGVYSGAIGYLGLGGTADLAIAIRTAVLAGGQVSIGTGGAIVALSDPAAELEETLVKARALLDVFDAAPPG